MNNMDTWNKLRTPPYWALKSISAGRLKGMTDISPQWRYGVVTEVFGPVGIGWKYEIEKLWTEPGSEGQICAFALVKLYTKQGDEWSDPIPGIGGSMLVTKETKGLHTSDEAFKMAVTDALSVAMKCLGVAADIYAKGERTKYGSTAEDETITEIQGMDLQALITEVGADEEKFCTYYKINHVFQMPASKFTQACKQLESKRQEVK